jgi:hypothetical protein
MPKLMLLVTAIEPTDYSDPQLRDLEPVMTDAEREAALVKGWNVKGVEPGGDDVFVARIAADMAPPDIETFLFQPVEIDARSVSGRGFIRSGQTQGSVSSDTITFSAVTVTKVEMTVIMDEQRRRTEQAKAASQSRTIRRDYMRRLRERIEDRLKGGAPGETPGAAGAAASSSNGVKAGK